MNTNIMIKVIDFVIRNFDNLYQYVSTSIDYVGIANQLKCLSFIVNSIAEMVRLLGSLYI